ncbi:histidinol-phosphatase [Leadbettera azotonutricia]|uniref:Histidinol-phosphatase n=1 Tax=Leadbettera azotonutricia (strain ATCC BAA-888 / DSM 13862 / ZAS-9) TaxID=545695 RepID=F5Y9X6_LEAAZ|nr:histidinol-phosphatase [Leadbettera azotonutricia]AEF82100.1 putative histidinol-phosphatase [Leadbettera azotonutricia ZAS-9]
MKLACIHTHTSFCDGEGSVEDFCQAAYEKGLQSLGFSAHAPVFRKTGIKTGWNLPEENLEAYLDAVRAAKKRWEGKLPVYLGLEVDFIPGLISPGDKDYKEMGLDYTIGSVHFMIPPKGALFTVDGPIAELESGIREGFGGDTEALVNAYWDNEEALISGGGFTVLGHIDLIRKNNAKNRFFREEDAYYRRRIEKIAALAGQRRIVVEINTGGMNRKRIDSPYPSLPLLRLLKENQVPMVINADAHKPGDLDGHYKEACEAMLLAGYTETVLFSGSGVPLRTCSLCT